MQNLLTALRHETSHIHNALHDHPVLKSCIEGMMNKEEYKHLLKAFYSPWKLVLPEISRVPIESLKPPLERRGQAIYNDLMQLEADPRPKHILRPNAEIDQGRLLGMCYVLIGSSMGAQDLVLSIKESVSDVPTSYLSISPKEAGWPILVSKLKELKDTDYPNACEEAVKTFKSIYENLS